MAYSFPSEFQIEPAGGEFIIVSASAGGINGRYHKQSTRRARGVLVRAERRSNMVIAVLFGSLQELRNSSNVSDPTALLM